MFDLEVASCFLLMVGDIHSVLAVSLSEVQREQLVESYPSALLLVIVMVVGVVVFYVSPAIRCVADVHKAYMWRCHVWDVDGEAAWSTLLPMESARR